MPHGSLGVLRHKSAQPLSLLAQATKALGGACRPKDLSIDEVYAHLSAERLSPIKHSFSCIDFKGRRPIIGTPGGDIGEFLLGYNCYLDARNQRAARFDEVKSDLAAFINQHCSRARPFYKHTDKGTLDDLVREMGAASFPERRPANSDEWLGALSRSQHTGCGHFRSILSTPEKYSLQADLPAQVVRAFYDLYWDPSFTPKLLLEVLPAMAAVNPQAGLVIHDHVGVDGCCTAFTPNVNGTGLFSLNLASQSVYRAEVIVPFFTERLPAVGKKEFTRALNERFATYWCVTGGYLDIVSLPMVELKSDGYRD